MSQNDKKMSPKNKTCSAVGYYYITELLAQCDA